MQKYQVQSREFRLIGWLHCLPETWQIAKLVLSR